MRSSRAVGLAALLVAVAGCSHGSEARLHEKTIKLIRTDEDALIRRWEGAAGETFLITQRGPVFTKWRVYDYVVTERVELSPNAKIVGAVDGQWVCAAAIVVEEVGDRGTNGEMLSRVDTQLEECFTRDGPIDCDQLREDPELARYITWLDD